MYNLDINFLKDRGLDQTVETSIVAEKRQPSINDKIPIAAGLIALVVFPAITFSYLKKVEAKTTAIEQEIKQIEGEITALGNQNKKIEEVNQQIKEVEAETQALVGVFEKLRPWAAILQEVSDRTPPGVQVDSIRQNGSGTSIGVSLSGVARTYADVNDFVLFLERSPFFDRKNIVMGTVNSTSLNFDVENEEDLPDNISYTLPSGVKYSITAQLNNVPASQLIEEINNQGSVGIVTRLKTLERKGAISK